MKKLRIVGIYFVLVGLVVLSLGTVVLIKAQAGLDSLDAVYERQGLSLSYDENGNFVDRGSIDDGNAILSLLTDDWKYPLNRKNLNPNDPLVNTPDELMVQYAIISYHVMRGVHTVVLEEDVEYNGEVFTAGTYEVGVDGRYWGDFDRKHPLYGPIREKAWSPTAHGLLAEISAGVDADYQAGFAHFMGMLIMGFGFIFMFGGGGLYWASKEH